MRSALASLLLLLLACNGATPPAPPAAETQPAPPRETPPRETPPPVSQTPPEITIDSVTGTNPLTVAGRARTFENSVSLRARDANGVLIVETFTTSDGEMGRHNPYEAQLWLVRDPGPRVTVDVFEYSAKDGSVRSLARKTIDSAAEPIAVTLFFPLNDCDRIAPFERRIPKSQAMARLLVEALIAGPIAAEKAAGATSPFPEGSQLRSVNLRDGVLTVDFSERLQNVGGACAARAIRDSVTRTLQQLPTVKSVVITAGGSRDLALQP